MKTIAFALTLFAASDGFCETPVKDTDALRALLSEVRQLRHAVEALSVTSQRVQIALYTLQVKEASVARAAQRLDDIRKKCLELDTDRQRWASFVQRMESKLESAADAEAKDIRLNLPQSKSTLDSRTAELQACQAAEAEAAGQLRTDQLRLDEAQDRVDRLDKMLENLGVTAK